MKPYIGIAAFAAAAGVYTSAQTPFTPPDENMLRLAQRMTVEAPPDVADAIRKKSLAPFFKALRNPNRTANFIHDLHFYVDEITARGGPPTSESQRFVTYYMVWQLLDQDCRQLEKQKVVAEEGKRQAQLEIESIKARSGEQNLPVPKGYAYPDELPRLKNSGWTYIPFMMPTTGGIDGLKEGELAARYQDDVRAIGNADAETQNNKTRVKLGELRTEALTLFERLYKDVARYPKW